MKSKKLLRALTWVFGCTYSIVTSVVRVAVYSWTHVPCLTSEHYHIKAESSKANEGLLQSFSSAKPEKGAAGKEKRARFDFVCKLRLGRLGAVRLLHGNAYGIIILNSNSY